MGSTLQMSRNRKRVSFLSISITSQGITSLALLYPCSLRYLTGMVQEWLSLRVSVTDSCCRISCLGVVSKSSAHDLGFSNMKSPIRAIAQKLQRKVWRVPQPPETLGGWGRALSLESLLYTAGWKARWVRTEPVAWRSSFRQPWPPVSCISLHFNIWERVGLISTFPGSQDI